MIRSHSPLSTAAIQYHAPSVFAQEAHGSRSDRYTFIPTASILDGLKAEGFEVYAAGQSRTRLADKRDFTRHVLRLRHQDHVGRGLKVGDSLPEIVLTNSHDGSSGYQLSSGFFRLVCSNGMVVGTNQSTVKVRHSGNVMGEVIEGATRILDDLQIGMSRIEEFQSVQLQPLEQMAFANAARLLRWNEGEAPVSANSLLTARRWDDRGADLWTTFNRVQESLIKGGVRGRNANGGRMSTRAVTGVAEDIRLNKALWSLADSLAAMKSNQAADVFVASHEASFA
jgi:Domain of unknown function (DUF932)